MKRPMAKVRSLTPADESLMRHAVEVHGLRVHDCPQCAGEHCRRCGGEGVLYTMDRVSCGPDCLLPNARRN